MSDQFLGEIRMVAFNFPQFGWAYCNGQIVAISQMTALFSLLGTFYGGDGRVTFGLPNLQSRVALDFGDGIGLTPRDIGELGGVANVTLQQSTMGAHTHLLNGDSNTGTSTSPSNTLFATPPAPPREHTDLYVPNQSASPVTMDVNFIGLAGTGLPHNNLQQYLVINFVIALSGIFPRRG
jgi:microcystin-dependent protein